VINVNDQVVLSVLSGSKEKPGTKEKVDEFNEVATFIGPRKVQNRYLLPGDRGGIVFQPEVKDHTTTLNLSGVTEQTKVRLQLFGPDKKVKKVRHGVTGKENVVEVVQTLILDDAPPGDLKFVEPPAFVVRGGKLEIAARVTPGPSGIREVTFYLGRPGADGKFPADSQKLLAEQDDTDPTLYHAAFPIAKDQKSPLTVSVVATNGVGLTKAESIDIPVKDPTRTRATIAGRVFVWTCRWTTCRSS